MCVCVTSGIQMCKMWLGQLSRNRQVRRMESSCVEWCDVHHEWLLANEIINALRLCMPLPYSRQWLIKSLVTWCNDNYLKHNINIWRACGGLCCWYRDASHTQYGSQECLYNHHHESSDLLDRVSSVLSSFYSVRHLSNIFLMYCQFSESFFVWQLFTFTSEHLPAFTCKSNFTPDLIHW